MVRRNAYRKGELVMPKEMTMKLSTVVAVGVLSLMVITICVGVVTSASSFFWSEIKTIKSDMKEVQSALVRVETMLEARYSVKNAKSRSYTYSAKLKKGGVL